MKLYTEYHLKEAYFRGVYNGINHIQGGYFDVQDSLTPIVLPSDEEIEWESRNHCNIKQDLIIDHEERYYKDFQKYDAFIDGAKWLKEQILNQNNK